jgi:hypothetical protein
MSGLGSSILPVAFTCIFLKAMLSVFLFSVALCTLSIKSVATFCFRSSGLNKLSGFKAIGIG